ncbi:MULTISPECIES: dienelactone hydrolase [unclassified Herbaspirillum]|nr:MULTISPECIES: dienelactone hydrolase [unclassified Herbaspirillum]RFB70997.1 dienelactone hydrolase [Herbaspirillum sp. 3R-3a1]TFI08480.1 dienelactone hydrolase [Herbaspirillum sp. 3R11]TFI14895.1 dienelactone hydrolase [Herbaspirillum sp. 3R-11]TFI19725.1 dienelactone hydrolase [Herbaspirillum sp. 3C11]
MKKISLLRALLISVMGMLLCLAADVGAVGFQHVTAPDPDGAPLEVGIWYPSTATPVVLPTRTVTQTVAADAPVDGKALPLIVISHGTGGSYLGHYDTAIALAEAGFVVAAVTHTGDNYADQSRSLFILERPRHISRVIDYMLSGWSGHVQLDAQKIGMFGFSAGGFTTLVSIGGRPDMVKIAPFCAAHTADFACQLIARNRGVVSTVAAAVPAKDGTKDDRIKAAVVAAPAIGFTFSPDGLREVTMPVQLWRAEDDVILPHPSYAEAVRLALPKPPEYHVVPNAGHFDFLAPCNEALATRVPEICNSAPGFDRRAFHASLNQSVVEFFRRALNAGR